MLQQLVKRSCLALNAGRENRTQFLRVTESSPDIVDIELSLVQHWIFVPEGTLTRSKCQRDLNHFLHDLYSLPSGKLQWPVSDNEANMSSFIRMKFKGRIKTYWTAYCTSCSWSDRTITPISAIFPTCSDKKHRWQSTLEKISKFEPQASQLRAAPFDPADAEGFPVLPFTERKKAKTEIFVRCKARPHHSF